MPAPNPARPGHAARGAPKPPPAPDWSALLVDAVNNPGVLSSAYSRFWRFSVGNQLLALFECLLRKLDPGPINTFGGWLKLGRHVRKGEKAITLCMPITLSRTRDPGEMVLGGGDQAERQPDKVQFTRFVYKPHWFVLCQTDGETYVAPPIPQWDERAALHALHVDRVAFRHTDGNVQGYASGRSVAVSPVAVMPHKTLFHELAHVLLGHTQELGGLVDIDMTADDRTPRHLREVEAECVALICCESLGMPGVEFCRGYVQHWLGSDTIPERSAQRIFKAADQILKAGRSEPIDSLSEESSLPIETGKAIQVSQAIETGHLIDATIDAPTENLEP